MSYFASSKSKVAIDDRLAELEFRVHVMQDNHKLNSLLVRFVEEHKNATKTNEALAKSFTKLEADYEVLQSRLNSFGRRVDTFLQSGADSITLMKRVVAGGQKVTNDGLLEERHVEEDHIFGEETLIAQKQMPDPVEVCQSPKNSNENHSGSEQLAGTSTSSESCFPPIPPVNTPVYKGFQQCSQECLLYEYNRQDSDFIQLGTHTFQIRESDDKLYYAVLLHNEQEFTYRITEKDKMVYREYLNRCIFSVNGGDEKFVGQFPTATMARDIAEYFNFCVKNAASH